MESLNDPYEMLPDFVQQCGRHAPACSVRVTMREILKNTGMICMSKDVTSPALWAHYAENHTGVALQFTFADCMSDVLLKVNYINKRVQIGLDDDLNNRDTRERIMDNMLRTKATCWKYEKEFRLVYSLHAEGIFVDTRGLFFRHLPEELTAIVLGVDCATSEVSIRESLDLQGWTDIKVLRAKLHHSRFRMCVNE